MYCTQIVFKRTSLTLKYGLCLWHIRQYLHSVNTMMLIIALKYFPGLTSLCFYSFTSWLNRCGKLLHYSSYEHPCWATFYSYKIKNPVKGLTYVMLTLKCTLCPWNLFAQIMWLLLTEKTVVLVWFSNSRQHFQRYIYLYVTQCYFRVTLYDVYALRKSTLLSSCTRLPARWSLFHFRS